MIITLRSDVSPDFLPLALDVAARFASVKPQKYFFRAFLAWVKQMRMAYEAVVQTGPIAH